MEEDLNRAPVAGVLAKWLANAAKVLDGEGQPESHTAPLLEALRYKLEQVANDIFSERDKLLSEGNDLVPDWPEKIANLRMASQFGLLIAQLKATEHLTYFPNRLMSAVDIMWYLTLDDQADYDELCRSETDVLSGKRRSGIRAEWHEFIYRMRKQTAAKHVRRCWDDELKAVSTWNVFRNEFIEIANQEWRLRRRRIRHAYWKDRILSLFGFSKK